MIRSVATCSSSADAVSLGLQFSPKVGFENSLIDVPFGSFRWG